MALSVTIEHGGHGSLFNGSAVSDGDTLTDGGSLLLTTVEADEPLPADRRFELRLHAVTTSETIDKIEVEDVEGLGKSGDLEIMHDAASGVTIPAGEFRSVHCSMMADGLDTLTEGRVTATYSGGTLTWDAEVRLGVSATPDFDPADNGVSGDNEDCTGWYEFDRQCSADRQRYTTVALLPATNGDKLTNVWSFMDGTKTGGACDIETFGLGASDSNRPEVVRPKSSVGCGYLPAFDGGNIHRLFIDNADMASVGGFWTNVDDRSILVAFRTLDDIASAQVIVSPGNINRGMSLVIDTGRLYANCRVNGQNEYSCDVALKENCSYIAVLDYIEAGTMTLTVYEHDIDSPLTDSVDTSGITSMAAMSVADCTIAYGGSTYHGGPSSPLTTGDNHLFLGNLFALAFYDGAASIIPAGAIDYLARKYNPWCYSTYPTLATLKAGRPQISGTTRTAWAMRFTTAGDDPTNGQSTVNGVDVGTQEDYDSCGALAYDAVVDANFATYMADAESVGCEWCLLHMPGGRYPGGIYPGNLWLACTDGRRDFLRSSAVIGSTMPIVIYVGVDTRTDDLTDNIGVISLTGNYYPADAGTTNHPDALDPGRRVMTADIADPLAMDAFHVNYGYFLSAPCAAVQGMFIDASSHAQGTFESPVTGDGRDDFKNHGEDFGFTNLGAASCMMMASKYLWQLYGIWPATEAYGSDFLGGTEIADNIPALRLSQNDPGSYFIDTDYTPYDLWHWYRESNFVDGGPSEDADAIAVKNRWGNATGDAQIKDEYSQGIGIMLNETGVTGLTALMESVSGLSAGLVGERGTMAEQREAP